MSFVLVFFSDSLPLQEQLTTCFFLSFDTIPVNMRLMVFTSSVSSTFFIAHSRGPPGSWATSPLFPGPPGQARDGRWQERSWQQERRTEWFYDSKILSPEEHRDSVSPTPCKAKTSFDTWGPDRLVYSHSHFQPGCLLRCILFREYNLGTVHVHTAGAYMCGTAGAEAHSRYVLPACAVDTFLSELGGKMRI